MKQLKLALTRLKRATLFLALSLGAAAQTTSEVSGVTLSGSIPDPVLVNHSGKTVIAALVVLMDANRHPWVSYCLFTKTTLGVSDGDSAKACGTRESQAKKLRIPIVSSAINAVIFSDGEFRGRDSYEGEGVATQGTFQSNTEMHLQSMRQIWQMAKDGDWAGVKAVADKNLAEVDSMHGRIIAEYLVELQSKQGSDKAVSSTSFLGSLPTTTWSGPLNRLQLVPNMFHVVADWAMPTAHAQSSPFCCTATWPQGGTLDAWHPNVWTYTCTTFMGHSNPCPVQFADAPPEGAMRSNPRPSARSAFSRSNAAASPS